MSNKQNKEEIIENLKQKLLSGEEINLKEFIIKNKKRNEELNFAFEYKLELKLDENNKIISKEKLKENFQNLFLENENKEILDQVTLLIKPEKLENLELDKIFTSIESEKNKVILKFSMDEKKFYISSGYLHQKVFICKENKKTSGEILYILENDELDKILKFIAKIILEEN